MPQETDIVLDGAGYMIAPASGATATYVRTQDGMAEGRTARIQIRDFFGGQHRAFQLERDRGGDSLAIGPAFGGQGVVPWPHSSTVTLATSDDLPDAGTPVPATTIGEYVFFARGRFLFRTVAVTATTWASEMQVWDAGSGKVITGLANYNGDILIALGTTTDLQVLAYPGGGVSATLLAGEKGRHVVGYGGFALYSQADASLPSGTSNQVRMVTGSGIDVRYLDAELLRLTTAGGKVFAATKTALYSFSGKVQETTVTVTVDPGPPPVAEQRQVLLWNGDWDAYVQQGNWTEDDDYRVIVGYGGRLYVWLNKSMLEHNPSGERAGWRDTGLGGARCTGGCVAGGYLVVAIETHDHRSELWAWNGAGWWRIASRPMDTGRWCWPIALSGAGNWDLLVFTEGSSTIDLFRLIWRSDSRHALPAEAEYVTSMIDAGERDKQKAWRKIGAVFASPEIPPVTTSTDTVDITLAYSIDGGETWIDSTSRSLAGSSRATANVVLDIDISSDAAVSRWIQIRLTWSGISNWAPVLTGVWAEYEVLDAPARRRRWQMTVVAHDQVVDRQESALSRSGRDLIADLWSAWQAGTTLGFRDIDHDAAPVERRVRIVGITEKVARPADAGRWGDATVALTLVEV